MGDGRDQRRQGLEAKPWKPVPADGTKGRRWFAVGDPQTTFERFLQILQGHELLDGRGGLRDEVGLVSIGDHFDFAPHGRALSDVGRDGTRILRWLAEHPPDQVVILMGNHDAARVMELAFESDESFARARAMAETKASVEEFARAFPRIPTPDIASRDYSSFAVHQRELVQRLLLAGRMKLASVGVRATKPILLTHAGVTLTELEELGVGASPDALAEALNERLRSSVDRVRRAWTRGDLAALDLGPLHVAGRAGREGGGLLYHRASHRADAEGASLPLAPRRFHPTALPRGLVQVYGHTGHHKCREELAPWLRPSARERERGGLRTLAVGRSGIAYEAGVRPTCDEEATAYLIDIEMNSPNLTDYPLFELESVSSC